MKSENIENLENRIQVLENSLRENVRKLFKGLSSEDFDILKFFYEKRKASKYEASVNLKIPRATVYRRIQVLKEKGFLEVVDKKTFQRGSLKSEVEILKYTVKGILATFGSNINLREFFEGLPPEIKIESSTIAKLASYEVQLEFFNKLFEKLNYLNEDLTDKRVDLNTIANLYLYLAFTNMDFLNYIIELSKKIGIKTESLELSREVLRLLEILIKKY